MSRWDVRVRISVLHDPNYLRLSPDAFATLILLQCMSGRDEIKDGFVPSNLIEPGPGYSGLPIVPPERVLGALGELEAAGLLERTDDGVWVTWEYQTTRAERDQLRAAAAERQRRKRERDQANNQAVTRDVL